MGKWTQAHLDDVFASRLKNIVCSVIDKSKVEKDQGLGQGNLPSISYETFVEDLDEKDAFTVAVIEALVNEYAERRQLTATITPQLHIAERTANALHSVVENASIYGNYRPHRPSQVRRRSTAEFFLGPGGGQLDYDLDRDFELYFQEPESGSRQQASLHDAYYPSMGWGNEENSRRAMLDDDDEEMPLPAVPPRMRRLDPSTGISTSLARQPTLRRTTRSRTVDFNEFTSRRRSVNRHSGPSNSTMDVANLISGPSESEDLDETDELLFAHRAPYRQRFTSLWGSAEASLNPYQTENTNRTSGSSLSLLPRNTLPRLRRGLRNENGWRPVPALVQGSSDQPGSALPTLRVSGDRPANAEPDISPPVDGGRYPTPRSITPDDLPPPAE